MLRTLLFVLVLAWLLVASAIAFVPIVGGDASLPRNLGTLIATCDHDSVPRGADTLLRCRYEATNISGRDWADARMLYAPASDVTIPDHYPAAGQGPMPEGAATPLRPLPLSLLACGATLALLGASAAMRRVRRRR